MIIGRGDIASVIQDREDYIFFASGVSDSSETRKTQFQREKDLLEKTYYEAQNKYRKLVYISSLSIYYSYTPYTRHKISMENMVKSLFKNYAIIRIGNITWGTNKKTLINHLRNDQSRIEDKYRYIIDKEEFNHWLGLIPDFNTEMNITGRRMKIAEIVRMIKEDKL